MTIYARSYPPEMKRCNLEACNMKLNLASQACKCGGYYCPKHRHCELHNCAYDFQAETKKYLSSQLIKVVSSKMEKL